MREPLIRRAVPEDVKGLLMIEQNSFSDPWNENDIRNDIMQNDRAYLAVALSEGRLAGYADMWIVAGEAQLLNIVVDREFRGRGYGRALMEHMIETACGADCCLMTLEVRSGNDAAIGLYEALGFRTAGIRRAYYLDNNEDAILMDLELQ